MRKKKIFNRILLLIIFLISIDILYKSDNVILQVSKQAKEVEHIVILGSGYLLNVDFNGNIKEHDPFMVWPSMKWFEDTTMMISVYYPFLKTKELERAQLEREGQELIKKKTSLMLTRMGDVFLLYISFSL